MVVRACLRFHSTQSPPTSWTAVPIASSCLSLSFSFACGTRPRLATKSLLAAFSSADCVSSTSAARLLPYAASARVAPETVSMRLSSKPRSRVVGSARLGLLLTPPSSSRSVVILIVSSRMPLSSEDVTSPSVVAEALNWLTAAFWLAVSAVQAGRVHSRMARLRAPRRRRGCRVIVAPSRYLTAVPTICVSGPRREGVAVRGRMKHLERVSLDGLLWAVSQQDARELWEPQSHGRHACHVPRPRFKSRNHFITGV